MRTIVDLHLHSHYSRATSSQLTPAGLAEYGSMKGVDVIATGDITHPRWLEEIESVLEEDDSGFLRMKDRSSEMRFVLVGEIACIYSKGGKTRRIHTLVGVSSLEAAKKANKALQDRGCNITSDGRPIIGMDVVELMKMYLDADPQALIIPAHIWTPWFSLFGSKSGFDTMEDCFGDMSQWIYGVETGLSSDPEMNWRISDLNTKMILSNSDAHSPQKIGREANVFNWKERTYKELYQSLQKNKNLEYTIEFFPEEGKYHLDGHRACDIRFEPKETKKHKGICPKCGLPVVVGVMNRVDELADQSAEVGKKSRPPFKSIVPLQEIIASALGVKSVTAKKVQQEYRRLVEGVGNEFHILLDASLEEITPIAQPAVAEGIRRVRQGRVYIEPGYDGVFGVVDVFTPEERAAKTPQQQALFFSAE